MKYLMKEQLKSNLSLGKLVQQWLPPKYFDTYTVIRVVDVEKNDELLYDVRYWEHFDAGNENFTDVVFFSFVNPDDPAVINTFDTIDEALSFAANTYNAS